MTATSIFETTRSLIPVPRRAPARRISQIAAQAAAWLAIGLGTLKIAAPTQLAARLGRRRKEPLLRRYGDEIAAGLAALAGFLAPALGRRNTARNVAIAIGAVGGIALLNLGIAALVSKRLHPR